ncbi:Hpt domain-containing protein [Puniceicoccales bacterium CK1056]|uniref:Hpt domain-containing protein n=1 Tax=Oceanipulchritudo coccoides TaxID=2706888 RepID=A0A6B2M078_9BACT|nr:Hpt domain-containing protein [Oceanipulchritudo coccoides]NDV61150.1 Hpt domain-containing protein [Oceanipulchritudo coccoides]
MLQPDHLDSYAHLLDREQLDMLIEAGGDDSTSLLDEIFGLFESESREKLEELQNYKAQADYEKLGKAAHALAGSSANIGGRELARQAKQIEDLCKSQNGEEAATLVDSLEITYRDTILALKKLSGKPV